MKTKYQILKTRKKFLTYFIETPNRVVGEANKAKTSKLVLVRLQIGLDQPIELIRIVNIG